MPVARMMAPSGVRSIRKALTCAIGPRSSVTFVVRLAGTSGRSSPVGVTDDDCDDPNQFNGLIRESDSRAQPVVAKAAQSKRGRVARMILPFVANSIPWVTYQRRDEKHTLDAMPNPP